MLKKYLLIIALLINLFIHAQNALAQPPVVAKVDRASLSLDEQISLTVIVTGDFFDIPVPNLANLVDFTVLGKQFSVDANIIKGQIVSQWIFVYRLQPLREGNLIINPIEVEIQGQIFQTDPIPVEVTTTPAPVLPPDDDILPAPDSLNQQDFFIEATIDHPNPYLGQQIIYTFRLYQATTFAGQPDYHPPSFTNFWSQTILSQPHYQTTLEGRHYFVTEVRTAIFPATLGTINIAPAKLIIPNTLLSARQTLETNPITIQVKSLPKNAPASFSGAVGQFTIRANLSQTEGRVNEPLTLIIEIEGSGNVETLPEPSLPELTNWRIFASRPSTKVEVQEDGVYGVRRFERLIFASQAGDYTFPSIEFSYYDLKVEEYRTIKTDPIAIKVLPGETEPTNGTGQPLGLRAVDIRPLKPVPDSFYSADTSLNSTLLYGSCWISPLVLVGAAWAYHKRQQRLAQDIPYARRQRAHQVAQQLLREAQTSKTSRDSYGLLQRALLGYLSDKFNCPTVGLTQDELTALLQKFNVETALINQIQVVLAQIELNRFAPTEQATTHALIKKTQELLKQLEKKSSMYGVKSKVIFYLLLPTCYLLLATSYSLAQSTVSPIEAMQMANQAYQAGQYGRAVTAYQAIVDAGLQHSSLYYNLGNAYFKQEDWGRAILNYRRAQSLAPRDKDIATNLAIARAHTADQLAEKQTGLIPYLAWLTSSWLTLGETKVLVLVIWLAVTAWAVPTILWTKRRRICSVVMAGLGCCLLIGLASMLSQIYLDRLYPPVVVVAHEVEVTNGPGSVGRYVLELQVHHGTEAHLLERRGGWYLLAFPNNMQGWVSAEAVVTVW